MTTEIHECYSYDFFEEEIEECEDFTISQKRIEVILPEDRNYNFARTFQLSAQEDKYTCHFIDEGIDPRLPCTIITIKENYSLLQYVLQNLKENEVMEESNVIVVDDRPFGIYNESLCGEYEVSYISVKYDNDFNFSMLNNIAAHVAHQVGCKDIVLWNADLSAPNKDVFKTLFRMHKENKNTITGTKLLYPETLWDQREESINIQKHYPHMNQEYKGTVQYGGSVMFPKIGMTDTKNTVMAMTPGHYGRFLPADHHAVCCDKPEHYITGAFCIIDLEWFVKNGGLNPSLSRNYQDGDMCLRANEQQKKVMYYAKDKSLYFYHDESFVQNSLQEGKGFEKVFGNMVLFCNIWKMDRIYKILTGMHERSERSER